MFHFTHHSHQSPAWSKLFVTEQPAKRVIHKNTAGSYERHTLADSIHKACMKVFGYTGEAELTAMRVCKDVEHWLVDKEEVTKADIKRQAAAALCHYNPRAAYAYLPIKEYKVHEDEYGIVRL